MTSSGAANGNAANKTALRQARSNEEEEEGKKCDLLVLT